MGDQTENDSGRDHISATISGVSNSQVAVGKQIQQVRHAQKQLEPELFAPLHQAIRHQLKGEEQEEAMKKAAALEEELMAKEPDVNRLEQLQRFFKERGGQMAAAVEKIFQHPAIQSVVKHAAEVAMVAIMKQMGIG